jgi:hypothetical protein
MVEELRREAVEERGVPLEIAASAGHATLRALGGLAHSEAGIRIRCRRYFWAVVKRRLVSRGGTSAATHRIILATVIEDLLGSGRDNADVWTEIERGWSQRVSREVLEECRSRLCA